jgi:hypothetical protein
VIAPGEAPRFAAPRARAWSTRIRRHEHQWLVVAGARAQYKGVGTLNGQSGYSLLLTAIDAAVLRSGTDAFRIKVWRTADDTQVIYDNQMGKAEDGSDATKLDGVSGNGSIVIHTPNK